MRKITPEELKGILDKHSKWLKDEKGGERADLSYCDLDGASLDGASLDGATGIAPIVDAMTRIVQL